MFLIYVKLKQKIQETDIYIIALAVVDIFMSVIVCPQYPLLTQYVNDFKNNNTFALTQFMYSMIILLFIYLQLLCVIALNRLYAVYKPYNFHSSIRRACLIIVILFIASGLHCAMIYYTEISGQNSDAVPRFILTGELVMFLTILTISYLLIAFKLYKRKQNVIKPKPTITNENQQNKKVWNNAIYIKSIKMFGVITLIFIASFIPAILINFRLNAYYQVNYLSFFNHNTNFLSYMYFNADFRKHVFATLKNCRSICWANGDR